LEIHSHLLKTEIIGLLGGIYDPVNKMVYVKDVFPCKGESTNYQVIKIKYFLSYNIKFVYFFFLFNEHKLLKIVYKLYIYYFLYKSVK